LHARGYSQQEAWQLAADYNLQYAIIGVWRYRLIIPFYDSLGKLVSWTGRSIVPDEKLRYKTLDSKTALVMPTSLLLSLPMLWTASYPKALIICEGPFDAMRITVTGAASGVYGTCLFGLQISDAQVALLEQLATRFKLYLLLDHDAQMQAFGISQRLARLGCEVLLMPYDVKDPGALSSAQTSTFITEVLYRMEGNHARKNG
jgi:DNA primase